MRRDSIVGKACPSPEVLRQFSHGELQHGLEEIASHLSNCSTCEQKYEEIASDTIDNCLRKMQTHAGLRDRRGKSHTSSELIPGQWKEYLASASDDVEDQPEQIGRFEIERRLGVGGFGQVLLATDPTLHRSVAIKQPHRHRLQTPKQRQAFLREGQILAKLEHPGLVSVFDVAETDDGQLYLVMEFVDGPSLSQALDANELSYKQRINIASSVVEALDAAHQRGLVHRDLKPSNILLRADGQAVVADFGLASETESNETQQLSGTPPYIAPELLSGESTHATEATDIWSLGVTLYRLLTGHRPYAGQTVTEVLESIKTAPVRPPSKVTPSVPESISRIVMKCLEVDPINRFQSVAEIRNQLNNATGRPKLAALALVATVLVGVATVIGVRSYQTTQTVENLLAAELTSLPPLIQSSQEESGVQSKLSKLIKSGTLTTEQELRARLALGDLSFPVGQYIRESTPSQCLAISQCLSDLPQESTTAITDELESGELSDASFLRLATILVQMDQEIDWSPYAGRIVRAINQELPKSVPEWFAPLRNDGVSLSSHIVDVLVGEYEPKRRMTLVRELCECTQQKEEIKRTLCEVELTPREFNALRPSLRKIADKDRFCDSLEAEFDSRLTTTPEETIERDNPKLVSRTNRLRNLVFALSVFDRSERLWQSLNDRQEPSLRTSLIHGLAEAGFLFAPLVKRLGEKNVDSFERGALVLALAEYIAEKDELVGLFSELYEQDADAYVHAAAKFGLDHFGQTTLRMKLDALTPPEHAGWTRRHGITFVRLDRGERNPYTVGTFQRYPDRSPSTAASSYYFSSVPVSIEQIRSVMPQRRFTPEVSDEKVPATRLDKLHPQDAYRYCVQLSKLDGMHPDAWCYEEVKKDGELSLVPKSEFLAKQGYRLPTDAEYAFAAAGGVLAQRYFGSVSYYEHYEWRSGNSEGRRRRPGKLRPNPYGIFDVLGNVKCFCQDNLTKYGDRADTDPRFESVSKDFQCFVGYDVFSARGGTYLEPATPEMLSATSQYNSEPDVDFPVGFRVVKTITYRNRR